MDEKYPAVARRRELLDLRIECRTLQQDQHDPEPHKLILPAERCSEISTV
jgi:hypothetical protein